MPVVVVAEILNLIFFFIFKVAQTNKDEPIDREALRKVTIIGTPEAQWKVCKKCVAFCIIQVYL